jgi:hypothetical protein
MAKKSRPGGRLAIARLTFDLLHFFCLQFSFSTKMEIPDYHLFISHPRLQFMQSATERLCQTKLELKSAV